MTVHSSVSSRTKSRTRVLMTATVVLADGNRSVLVRDVSPRGAKVYDDRRIKEGQDACFRRGPLFVAARVAWSEKGVAGLEFYRTLSSAELAEAFNSVILSEPPKRDESAG